MGYRSEVVLAVSKKMMPHFLGHLSQCDDAAYKFVFMEADKKIEDYDGEGTNVFSWDHIKWYDSYPEVKAITDFVSMNTDYLSSVCEDIEEFQRGSYAEHFRFVRLGEDYDDVEVDGWLCSSDIVINRAVSF
tara:strand:+ start:172 stop:567 length:396 start_codon:yes stop_codon:yes gene_type:complete